MHKLINYEIYIKMIKHKVKRYIQKIGIKLMRFTDMDKNEPHSKYENECIAICKLLVKELVFLKSSTSEYFILVVFLIK